MSRRSPEPKANDRMTLLRPALLHEMHEVDGMHSFVQEFHRHVNSVMERIQSLVIELAEKRSICEHGSEELQSDIIALKRNFRQLDSSLNLLHSATSEDHVRRSDIIKTSLKSF